MSRTDIFPPQSFALDGDYQVTTSSRTTPTSAWSSPTTSKTTNRLIDGAKSRQSLTTNNYIDASNRGALTENSFTYTENVDRHTQGGYSYETKGISGGYFAERYLAFGVFPDSVFGPPSPLTFSSARRLNTDNEVQQKVFAKVRDSDVNLAVMYGERNETFSMLAESLKRLGKAWESARHGDMVGAAIHLTGHRPRADISKTIANGWLELQYGWLPLMSDIFGFLKTVEKTIKREYIVVGARSKIHEVSPSLTISNGMFRDYTEAEALYEVSVRVKMKLTNATLKTLAETGITNPLLVAWELVPYSFAVDWALPIGNFLSQFDSALGYNFEQGSITRYYKRMAFKQRSVDKVPADYNYLNCELRRDIEELTVTRVGINSWSSLITIPYLKAPGSVIHCLNALALITQRKR